MKRGRFGGYVAERRGEECSCLLTFIARPDPTRSLAIFLFLRFSPFSLDPSWLIPASYLKLGHDHWSTLCNLSYLTYLIFVWL